MTQRQIRNLMTALVASATAIGLGCSAAALAHGRDGSRDRDGYFAHHQRMRGFGLGVCVGQALAQQGLTLPAPQSGQNTQLDAPTAAALKAAIKTCRDPADGANAQASPTPSASPSPSASSSATSDDSSTVDGSDGTVTTS